MTIGECSRLRFRRRLWSRVASALVSQKVFDNLLQSLSTPNNK